MGKPGLQWPGGTGSSENSPGAPRTRSELELLSEVAWVVSNSLSARRVMEHIVRLAARAVGADQARIEALVGTACEGSIPVASVALDVSRDPAVPLSPGLLRWILMTRDSFLSDDPRCDPRIPGAYPQANPRNIFCAPLMARGEINGILMVCNKRGAGGFTLEDQRLISILASQSGQVLENERLRNEERVLLDYREELHVASRIQRELLPKRPPDLSGYDVCSLNVPARMVGGDYFDFLDLGGGRHVVCIGDVCGKGLPAALLMANLQAIVRTQSVAEPPGRECLARCQRFFNEPARQCVERCNRLLQKSTPPERFVTLFYGILDTDRHSLLFTNAGLNPPLLYREGEFQRLRMGGIPLGIEEDWSYGQQNVGIEPGDLIVLYSDGITEARDLAGEEFGEERILSTVRSQCSFGTEQVLESLHDAVRAHVADAPQLDDMTLVLLKRHSVDRTAAAAN